MLYVLAALRGPTADAIVCFCLTEHRRGGGKGCCCFLPSPGTKLTLVGGWLLGWLVGWLGLVWFGLVGWLVGWRLGRTKVWNGFRVGLG